MLFGSIQLNQNQQSGVQRIKTGLLSAAILISIFSACTSKDKQPVVPAKASPPTAKAEAYILRPEAAARNIEVPGSLTPFEETDIHPEVSGRVTGIYFKEGSTISKGSVMVRLYDGDLQAQVKKLQVQLAIAEKTEQRQAQLLKINGISQQDYDLSQLAVSNLKADIGILQTSIAKTVIRAPYSGRIGFRNISMGAYITPQTNITTLRQLQPLKLVFDIPERYSSSMQPGQLVRFGIDGSSNSYAATIIANDSRISTDTRTLSVKAQVQGGESSLVAGGFVRVQITLGRNDAALMIPTQAIIPQARTKKVIVLRSGIASLENITTGVRDSARVEVTNGLKTGDTILTTGLLSIKPGSRVQIGKINNN